MVLKKSFLACCKKCFSGLLKDQELCISVIVIHSCCLFFILWFILVELRIWSESNITKTVHVLLFEPFCLVLCLNDQINCEPFFSSAPAKKKKSFSKLEYITVRSLPPLIQKHIKKQAALSRLEVFECSDLIGCFSPDLFITDKNWEMNQEKVLLIHWLNCLGSLCLLAKAQSTPWLP